MVGERERESLHVMPIITAAARPNFEGIWVGLFLLGAVNTAVVDCLME